MEGIARQPVLIAHIDSMRNVLIARDHGAICTLPSASIAGTIAVHSASAYIMITAH
jgi:hypothetical protein